MNKLLIQAMKYEYPETLPVTIGVIPAMWKKYGDELARLMRDYPQFFGRLRPIIKDRFIPRSYKIGETTDEWGCVWTNVCDGMEGYVTGHPIKTEQDIYDLKIPSNRNGSLPHGFMYLRLLDLYGFENTMMLFAEESEALRVLIDKVLEYNCYQVKAKMRTTGRVINFADDLGMQTGLAIGPEAWRKYMKPCYKKLADIVKNYKRFGVFKKETLIYMHSDGCIYEIMQDLKDCGIDMINPQYRANGLDNLVRVCKGKIPINLDLDRQMFPFASKGEIFDHIGSCVEALYLKEGGLGLQAELNYEIPLNTVAYILDALEKYRHYKG